MSNTTDGSGFLGSNNINGFGYGIGISIGILLLIITITLTSFFCTRIQVPSAPTRRRDIPDLLEPQHSILDVGLDESTILSYPKMVYSEAKLSKSDWTATCCSICLSDYKANDMLRVLPDCEHLFHPKCIDPWLRLHPTCPVCRTSPFPTPLSTPLAEVVPLASRRD
ncbi:putative transcription factor C2H2 family [Lupinus albus]|uniref:RING-type E3 ubiquitin transferase n=1 Tax=Lupinus albus TaxID=3870 RepID=A0A6A4R1E5_LUPAL|nr:putative transcription factor C2H2 family [Lupinus albus]